MVGEDDSYIDFYRFSLNSEANASDFKEKLWKSFHEKTLPSDISLWLSWMREASTSRFHEDHGSVFLSFYNRFVHRTSIIGSMCLVKLIVRCPGVIF